MKKLLLSLVAVLCMATVSAQNLSWGVKAGVNMSSIRGNGVSDVKYKADFVGGIFVEYQTCNWFSVSGEVLYSGQGYKSHLFDFDYTEDLSYINVPILANFYVTRGLALKTGLQPGFLVGSKARTGGSSTIEDGLTGLQTFNLAMPVGISYELNCGLLFDFRYNIDLTRINKYGDGNAYNSTFALTVGWKF